jgi:hypothetical protein
MSREPLTHVSSTIVRPALTPIELVDGTQLGPAIAGYGHLGSADVIDQLQVRRTVRVVRVSE